MLGYIGSLVGYTGWLVGWDAQDGWYSRMCSVGLDGRLGG